MNGAIVDGAFGKVGWSGVLRAGYSQGRWSTPIVGTVANGGIFVGHALCSISPFIRVGQKKRGWSRCKAVRRYAEEENKKGVDADKGSLSKQLL